MDSKESERTTIDKADNPQERKKPAIVVTKLNKEKSDYPYKSFREVFGTKGSGNNNS